MKSREKQMNVKVYELVAKLEAAAKAQKDDRMFNILCRVAERLAEVGTPYAGHWDGPLTPTEIKIIKRFAC